MYSHGLMAGDMKVILSTIRKRVKVFSSGLMVESTREDGKTVNNTELVLTLLLAVKRSKENGKKVKDFTGFKTNDLIFLFLMFQINKELKVRIFLIF